MGLSIEKNQTFGSLLDLFMGGKQGKWSGALSGLKFRKASRLYGPRRTRYSGEQLRKIRAEKGVGRPPAVTLAKYGHLRGLERLFVLGHHETPCAPWDRPKITVIWDGTKA